MEPCFNAANELYDETSAKNPKFKKVYEAWKPFRAEEILWFRVCENTFDNFMARMSAANKEGPPRLSKGRDMGRPREARSGAGGPP